MLFNLMMLILALSAYSQPHPSAGNVHAGAMVNYLSKMGA
jgi:hypothetical protein